MASVLATRQSVTRHYADYSGVVIAVCVLFEVRIFEHRVVARVTAVVPGEAVVRIRFAVALSGPVHFLLPDQQSGIHCLITCAIQLLTSNNSGGT